MSRVALVTGASGAVGTALLPALRAAGWNTRALVHRSPVPGAEESRRGDLGDLAGLVRAVEGAAAIVHLAAATHARRPSAYETVNVAGTRNLLAAASAAGITRFVHVSTRAIDPRGGAYSRSKAEAERLVRASGLSFTIVRLPEVYPTGGREGLDGIVERVRSGRRVPVVGDGAQEVRPISLDDAVGALVAALQREATVGKTYTLAGEPITVRGFAERAIAALDSPSRVVGIPTLGVAGLSALARFFPLPLYPDQLARLRAPKPAGDAAARAELGFQATPLEDMLRRALAPAGSGGKAGS